MLLFLVSLAMLWILTLFESFLSGLTTSVERLLSALILVLPAAVGVVFCIYKKRTIAGILLNGAFALFNILVLGFSG